MKKILLAVPTKDRSEMVKEVLDYESEYYKKYPLKLCYYDSGTDDSTKAVIEEAKEKYGLNIEYKAVDASLCLDYKVIEMFKEFAGSEYDYFWLINDSISICEEMIQLVIGAVEKGYDLIRLPLSGSGNISDYETEDVDDFFRNCSQGIAHMASTVMSRTLLDTETDWEELREKYVYNNELDDSHGYFFTVGFYYEQIAKLDSFKGLFIGNHCKWRRDSILKKNQFYWQTYLFETWAKSYPETILKLPDIYTDKENTIRKSDNIVPGRFSKEMLIHYRILGLYDIGKYDRFKQYFKYITDEIDETCYEIAVTPVEELRSKYAHLIAVEDEWDVKLEMLEKEIGSRDIYIYGAGLYGERAIGKLINDGFSEQIKSVLVTAPDENVNMVCGIKVEGIDTAQISANGVVIICTLPGTAKYIKEELAQRGIGNYIGLFDV